MTNRWTGSQQRSESHKRQEW